MSLRAADLRFLLPAPPRRVAVAGELAAARAGFAQAGIELVEPAAGPDLVVAAGHAIPELPLGEASAVLALGAGATRAVRRRRPVVRRLLALPGLDAPHLVVPVDRPTVASHAIRTWTGADSRLRRLRNGAAARLIAGRRFPDIGRSLALGLAGPAPPYVVAAAGRVGVPSGGDWFLTLGLGDALTRAVFHLFEAGGTEPRWVIKFARVPGYVTPFERDEHGLRLAESAGSVVTAHAPRLLGRFEVDGLAASVEQAAPGRRLTSLLQGPAPRRAKLRAIDAVAAWLVEVSRVTAVGAAELEPERDRLAREVVPAWAGAGLPADLVARVPPVPGVLQHNDVGCWNVIVDGDRFAAVDWESARRAGLPLWDLLYFLVDALVHLDGHWRAGEREGHAARLLLGEAGESSRTLMRWLDRGAAALEIPDHAVAPIATLGWLHHGLSPGARAAAVTSLAPGRLSTGTYGEWMARVWLTTPGLGADWPALERARRAESSRG